MNLITARLKLLESRHNLLVAQKEGNDRLVDTYARLCHHYHTKIDEWKRGEKHIYVE